MSRCIFGLHLDGVASPNNYQGLRFFISGPGNLLSALETSLGLPPTESSPLQRTLAYRDLLEASLTDDLFYSRSFKCAPLATARLLLSWRDNLVEAGWQADLDHSDAPPRLQCLAALESAFRNIGHSTATHAGRIAAILAELEFGSQSTIESLVVTDSRDALPQCWSNLFDALNASYDDLTPTSVLAAPSTSLGSVQANLLGAVGAPPGDSENLRVITAATPEAAAAALASQLTCLDLATTILIADPSERDTLNRHLQLLDLPLPTAKTETAAALLELPALVLRCRIAPLDPQAWIEFLLHTISPVPSSLRRRLADQINNLPGRGPHWEKALESCIAHIDDIDATARMRQAYVDWIEAPLIASDVLSGPALADSLSSLTQWLANRAGAKKSDNAADAPEWIIASRAVAQLESLFRSEDALTRTETNKLLAEWHHAASATIRFPGQVGSMTAIASPSQLLAPQDHIIWWRPTPTHTQRSPWMRTELAWLSSRNIILPDEFFLALAAEKATTRAVLFAGKSLTIYHVTQSAGGITEQAGILTRLLTQCGPSLIAPARNLITTEAIPRRPLPSLRRWWNLEQTNLLPARACESFSSVSKVIYSPVDWVLDYHAKLSSGSIAGLRVTDDALRAGSILHAAAEALFADPSLDWQNTSEPHLHQYLTDIFPKLLASQAAHYLTLGNEAALTRLLHSAQESLWHLIEILRESAVIEVTLEQAIAPVPFIGGQIGGRIDLIARRVDGKTAVIDLKHGGKTNRTDELRDNRHLQLATYGHLMRQSQNLEPATAYFILSNGGTLLTRNASFFPNNIPSLPKRDTPTSDWQECWQEFEKIYQWRRRQLDQGRIEVPVAGTEADDPPPIERWAPPRDGNPYSDYLNLTGYPSNA
jgi:hypothetical protein